MGRKFLKIDNKVRKDIKNGKITLVTQNSDKIKKNCIFVCIKGEHYDTNTRISEAFSRGARYVFGNIDYANKNYFKVKNSRKLLAYLLNIFYNFPDKKIKIIGVVGTNGKTSTTYIFRQICHNFGLKCGVIGTNGIYINDDYYKAKLTTPDSEELFFYLDKMSKEQIDFLAIEISAHAIYFDKVFSIDFYQLIFTNFSQDHLDFFKTLNNYKKAKLKIFQQYNYSTAIINIDDCFGRELYTKIKNNKLSYGKNGEIKLLNIQRLNGNSKIKIFAQKEYEKVLNLVPEYNIYNYMAVLTSLYSMGYDIESIFEHSKDIKNFKGRFQVIKISETHTIIIDYAHTQKSTFETLKEVKSYFRDSYIITIFGCPGDREREKREIISHFVSRFSDLSIITSDNPAYENPIKILAEIKKGIRGKYFVIENREKAVEKGVKIFLQKSKSTLVLLGKGIENCQIVNGIEIPYNDEREVLKNLKSVF